MTELLPFGPGALAFVGVYLLSLLAIGYAGRQARRDDSLSDFYLAGSGFGLVVLFLTLYATQYSGNALFGFVGAAYRSGFGWLVSAHFMVAIIVFYRLYAAPLRRLAATHRFVTPADYLMHRYGSRTLATVASLIMILALSNYLLAQLMTMGRVFEGLAGPLTGLAYPVGVAALAAIMLVYGTLGGMRAVAWTDVIQGSVLFVGFIAVLIMLTLEFGPLSAATDRLLDAGNEHLIRRPDGPSLRLWLSYILLVGIGGALYPQAIQRIYAARSARTLSQSFALMAFMPFVTVVITLIAGIYAAAYLPGLSGPESDQAMARLLRVVQAGSTFGYALVALLFAALLAALMSTADSAMLSISSMVTKDLYAENRTQRPPERVLTRLGKRCSLVVIVALTVLAIALRDHASLVALIDRKFDVLVQLAPAFMLGIHWTRLRAGPVLAGMVIGLVIALALAFGPWPFVVSGRVAGIHPGLIGLAINAAVAIGGSLLGDPQRRLPLPA
ncbi:MAG: sodium:solute symporter family protein [Pseudomonadota bacterium]